MLRSMLESRSHEKMQITVSIAKKNIKRRVRTNIIITLDNEKSFITNKKGLHKCKRATIESEENLRES